jgi:hypothetical protein
VATTDTTSSRHSRRIDPQARPLRWTKNGRSREAQLYRAFRQELIRHVGGNPSPAQNALINRLAMMQLHLARLDERIFKEGGLSEHSSRQYLAWSNAVTRGLARLGLEGAKERTPTPADHLAALYGR